MSVPLFASSEEQEPCKKVRAKRGGKGPPLYYEIIFKGKISIVNYFYMVSANAKKRLNTNNFQVFFVNVIALLFN